jgi:hypothetical protein
MKNESQDMKKLLLFLFGVAASPLLVAVAVSVIEYFRPYRRAR